MVEIENDHLGGAARGPAGLDGAGGAVADLEEAHQAARLAAAGQRLALAAQGGEIRAGAGAVFEDARLADPQVHDAAFVHQVVLDGLDEAVVDDDVVRQEVVAFRFDVVDVLVSPTYSISSMISSRSRARFAWKGRDCRLSTCRWQNNSPRQQRSPAPTAARSNATPRGRNSIIVR